MEKCFCYLKSHPKKFRWFLLWKGLASLSLGTGTWSLAGDGVSVSNMSFANFQENIPNLANSYEPLKNLNFVHAQQTFYRVYSWNLRRICPYWVFPTSSLQFMHHSLCANDHTTSPHRSCVWPPMQHREGSRFKCKGDNYLTALIWQPKQKASLGRDGGSICCVIGCWFSV